MEQIHKPNDTFDFSKIELLSPTLINGGNYFIKFKMDEHSIYIEPPKCKTKQGIFKSGKKYCCDLLFLNENEVFIRWIENLENLCKKKLFENREKWFETNLEEEDIENSMTPPLKIYKSVQQYVLKTNVPTTIGSVCNLKIYNENQEEVGIETIDEKTDVVSILEIQGIKCSPRNFQLEMEIKQMMVLKPVQLFEKCVFPSSASALTTATENNSQTVTTLRKNAPILAEPVSVSVPLPTPPTPHAVPTHTPVPNPPPTPTPKTEEKTEGISEIEFDLDKISENDTIQLKKRNEVYYEMYKEARRRAKIARDLAVSSYLEAKNIKNTYMLNGIADSESDDEDDEDEEDDNDN